MYINGILFDFMGTTAMEKDPSVIQQCFIKSFAEYGVIVSEEEIIVNRGRNKKDMIETLLRKYNHSSKLLTSILSAFNESLENSLNEFSEGRSTREVMDFLKSKNIKIGMGTGFPRSIFESIFNYLKWDSIGFDYIGIAEETGKGRPYPDMILDMIKTLSLQQENFLKVGDTMADIQEGKNAGVRTVAILSGTQSEADIINQKPDFVIHDLIELKKIIDS
ncbi:MAG: HAD family hydrolase [Sphingobacteriales bacterium]